MTHTSNKLKQSRRRVRQCPAPSNPKRRATQLPPLTEGEPEECACDGQLAIRHGERLLSEGIDGFSDRLQAGPRVTGYPLAARHLLEQSA